MYHQIAVTAVATALGGFAVGAALMSNYVAEHPPAPPPPSSNAGITGDIPVLGDVTRHVGGPIGAGLCQGAGGFADGVPVLEQLAQASAAAGVAVNGLAGEQPCHQ